MNKKATKYRTVRSRMLRAGTNPRRWAKDRGLPASSVYAALRGDRGGVKAVEICRAIEEFLTA